MDRIAEARNEAKELYMKLPEAHVYHNYNHASDVARAVKVLAEAEDVSVEARELLEVAALFHDVGYTVCYEANEEQAVSIVKEKLPDLGFDDAEIHLICGMIEATAMPQNPKNHLEQILCDADLDNLGREDFFEQMEKVRLERQHYQKPCTEPLRWMQQTLNLMENHEYFTSSAKKLRIALKEDNMRRLRSQIEASM